ncbi:MAG: hypothetical protein HHJ14_08940 [Cellulomonas sp.]|nr:hypothetical protein [Cellulomonas sp.]
MSPEGIFLQSVDGLTLLEQRAYESEALLQAALAQFPEVIAGLTTAGGIEPRLMLVSREMVVASADDVPGAFSLDHLFLDQAGVPVLVEVKRSSNSEIRRQVVGQMLDYAASAVKVWSIESVRQSFERTAEAVGRDPAELVRELRADIDVEEFWRAVESNLRSGRIRMVFVADALPESLVRIIEFLNEQMSSAEVLGIEVRQYVGGSHTVYVPRVVGNTSTAVAQKRTTGVQPWDEASFVAAVEVRCTPAEASLVGRLMGDVRERGVRLVWGKGSTPGVGGWYSLNGRPTGVWGLNANDARPNTRAYMVLNFGDFIGRIGVDRVEAAAKVFERIPGLTRKIAEARASSWRKYPSLYLADITVDPLLVDTLLEGIRLLTAPSDDAV